MKLQDQMLKEKVWAVIGVSRDDTRYANRIYRRLKSRGYRVYAVNPNLSEVDGDPCYANLQALPEIPAVINMVVAPSRGKTILCEAAALDIEMVWFQPGSWDAALDQVGQDFGLKMFQGCVLVATA